MQVRWFKARSQMTILPLMNWFGACIHWWQRSFALTDRGAPPKRTFAK
jgi:hypothetical protein